MPTMINIGEAVRVWANTLTGSLVGPGRPVALGFPEQRLRSPARGAYGIVDYALDDGGADAEGTTCRAAVVVTIFSATDPQAARAGALAVADALLSINQVRPSNSFAQLLMASRVTVADTEIVDASTSSDDEPSYQVRADVLAARPT
jgi:hypothetical protein